MSHSLPRELESSQNLPDQIVGYISINSKGGKAPFEVGEGFTETEQFHYSKADGKKACKAAESCGLEIIAESRIGISVAGPSGAFEELTGGSVVPFERLIRTETATQRYVTHIDIRGKGQPECCGLGCCSSDTSAIEAVQIERPRFLHGVSPSPIPPSVGTFHLRVPDDVSMLLGGTEAQRQGHRGQGVTVAMTDSGQYHHPYFAAHRYTIRPNITVVPGTDPAKDPHGHGTAESANIFALAPECELQAIRISNNGGALVGAIAGFLTAKQGNPEIITNSWGGDGPFFPTVPLTQDDFLWAVEIFDTIQDGILVVFSAGNGQFSVEPQVPGVLAAGGTYVENDLDFRASNYASGYDSPWFVNRTVPDVCGLVGLLPRALYIMLPVPPGSPMDVGLSNTSRGVVGDLTATNDGWARLSGTSAAAPQLAGVAAQILSAKPGLDPAQVISAMTSTATDVRVGNCHPRFNNPATLGHDLATGHGLVNATAAVEFALANF